MVGLISHSPKPVAANFYENSFKQLSDIQQKQVGLLVGASVADAAARALEDFSADEISALQRDRDKSGATSRDRRKTDEESEVVFADIQEDHLRGDTALSDAAWAELRRQRGRNPLLDHSFSYLLYFGLLRTMSSARGAFPVSEVAAHWVEASHRVHPTLVFARQHGTLLHTLCALLPIPTIYPYASDAALRGYVGPFLDSLTTPPELSTRPTPLVELAAAERVAVCEFTQTALGVVLRSLQSCPDPERNGALMGLPGTAALFSAPCAPFCPSCVDHRRESLLRRRADGVVSAGALAAKAGKGAEAESGFLPLRPVLHDARIVREAFEVCRVSKSFADGVVRAVRMGGAVCQRAMVVGALLGAKFGARRIPTSWISATADHKPVATMAIEVAQWSWNPSHY